jgi:hypothetical protein
MGVPEENNNTYRYHNNLPETDNLVRRTDDAFATSLTRQRTNMLSSVRSSGSSGPGQAKKARFENTYDVYDD